MARFARCTSISNCSLDDSNRGGALVDAVHVRLASSNGVRRSPHPPARSIILLWLLLLTDAGCRPDDNNDDGTAVSTFGCGIRRLDAGMGIMRSVVLAMGFAWMRGCGGDGGRGYDADDSR